MSGESPRRLSAGKLPAPELERVLTTLERRDPQVIVGPRLGEDAAVIDLGDRCLVVTTDPVTFATDAIGWYVVHVNANDIAVMGATPRWLLTTLLLPERGTTEGLVESIVSDIGRTCDGLGITVCGGHTEITTGLDRPIVVGQMIGEAPRDRILQKSNVRVGDRVLLTHGIAIEGTALLARERAGELSAVLSGAELARAQAFLFDPGISVVEAARTALEAGRVHAMHDPTEGGLVSGLYELAAGGGCGLLARTDRIPVYPETRVVCQCFGLDPLRLIASGALLIAAPADDAEAILLALEGRGIPTTEVAEVMPAEFGRRLETNGELTPLEPAARDEIARVFEADPKGE